MTENDIDVKDLVITPCPEGWLKTLHPAIGVMDDTAYVGVWIPCKVRDKKGGESERDLLFIITDKRERILANEEVLKGRGWQLQYKPILFENRWPLDDVTSYLEEGSAPSPSDLFNLIIMKWREYVWFSDQRDYAYHALWDFGTYLHTLFVAYPYPYLGGVKRSAKTKVLTIHSCLAFNAIFSMNMSTASIYRLIQNARCTILIDESEKLSDPNRALEFRSLLLAGYKRGQKVYRVEKTRKEQLVPESFEVYGPKAMANIGGLEDVLEERCKVTIMQRSLDRSIVDREVNEQDPYWAKLRAFLYRFYLSYWAEVRGWYEKLGELSEHGELVNFVRERLGGVGDLEVGLLSSRELELWRPILALALFFEERGVSLAKFTPSLSSQSSPNPSLGNEESSQGSLSSQVITLAIDSAKVRQTESMTETAELILVQNLFRLVGSDGWYKVKEIKEGVAQNWDEEQKWLTTNWVGRALRRLGFVQKRRVGTGYEYFLNKGGIEDLAKRMNVEAISSSNGTREKMDVILRIVDDLEAEFGSAKIEELEKRAMESGVYKGEFKTLLAAMLREGILYSVDEDSVKRARR